MKVYMFVVTVSAYNPTQNQCNVNQRVITNKSSGQGRLMWCSLYQMLNTECNQEC